MNTNRVDSILRNVVKLTSELKESLPDGFEGSYLTIPEYWDKQFLIEDSLETYEKIKDLLLQEKWGEKFSEKFIDAVIRKAIANTKKYGIEEAKQQFIEECSKVESYSTEMTVYIPLGGIQIDHQVNQPISLGNIELLHVSEQVLEDIQRQGNAITRTTTHSKEDIDSFIQEDNKTLSENFLHKVCAIHYIIAEPEKALEVANKETQKALNLLRYTIPAVCDRSGLEVRIDVDSLVPSNTQNTIVLSPKFFGKQWKRSREEYRISPDVMEILEDLGVFKLSELLQKSYVDLNEFEKVLLRGIYWFGTSQTHMDVENEFLNLTICLEVFFTPHSGDPISSTIAESTALWIGRDLEERKRIKDRIKKLYSKRSKVSHGGSNAIDEQSVVDLRVIARRVVTKMIERRSEFEKKKDVSSWLEDQKLS